MYKSVVSASIQKIEKDSVKILDDDLAVEEPLEIQIGYKENGISVTKNISVTMRTPGNDFELAAGFLFTEGLISDPQNIKEIKYCSPLAKGAKARNEVLIDLREGVKFDLSKLERHFYTSSSCGVCGKSSIHAVTVNNKFSSPKKTESGPFVSAETIYSLPDKLRSSQGLFASTGGIHATGLFSASGELELLKEDVGRHNAMDKMIGASLLAGKIPLSDHIGMVSGRASFELLQKASLAGIPIVAAVGAPSSLALELAEEFNITLLGFVSQSRFNIYHGGWRIK